MEMDGEYALLSNDLEICQGYGARWASISFFQSHNAFCKLPSTHTLICYAGWLPLPREGEGDRFVHFSHPCQDSRVKEALQLEGSSAPSIRGQLFREWKVSPNDIGLAAFSRTPA